MIVDVALKHSAREHGLDLRFEAVDETGWDFRVVHGVDDNGQWWVLRQPRRPDVTERIPVEERVLDLVRPRLPIEIPRWEVCSPDLIAYRRLRGCPLAEEDPLTLADRWVRTASTEYVTTLGATIAELHRVPVEEARRTGVTVRHAEDLRTEIASELETARRELGIPESALARWTHWLSEEDFWRNQRRLVHRDLSPNHTLVNDSGALLGVLDWADAAVDDPAQDFAAPCLAFGTDGLDRLLHAYAAAEGHVPETFREHVVQLANFRYRVSIGVHGLTTGNDDYVAIARSRLIP